jgi:hypothetical protein
MLDEFFAAISTYDEPPRYVRWGLGSNRMGGQPFEH